MTAPTTAPFAAVDIGTNSVKLTVARVGADGRLDVLCDTTRITRLGKNVDATGRLDPDAARRTGDALADFARQARNLGATRIAAVGTSALRDAANGAEFVREAEQILNGRVEIIGGEREATLAYRAARRDPDLALPPDALVGIIDIGGGSTEFVLGRGESEITFRDSLQIGAVRLTERALRSDPPTPNELRSAAHLADAVLASVPVPMGANDALLVGSGGTIANLAGMELGAGETDLQQGHGLRLFRSQIEARVQTLAAQTVAERRATPGLEPDRADVILGGALILARALHRLNASSVVVSLRGLRYGLLYEMAAGSATSPLV